MAGNEVQGSARNGSSVLLLTFDCGWSYLLYIFPIAYWKS